MSRRSLADTALLSRVLGTEIRAAVAVGDPDLLPLQRRELVARCAVCAAGFVLASLWGTLLPLAISVLSGWDHFLLSQLGLPQIFTGRGCITPVGCGSFSGRWS